MLSTFKNMFETDIVSLLTPKRQLVGLDIGSSAIKLVQLRESKGRYYLQKFGMKPLEPEVIVDGTVMDEARVVSAIRELFDEANVKNKQVAVSISGHAVIVKKISLPPMPDEELEGQVKLAAEQYIPFDINEVNIDFHVLPADVSGEGQGEMSIILVAAKKDKINELTELVKGAGLMPMVMDVDPPNMSKKFQNIDIFCEPVDRIDIDSRYVDKMEKNRHDSATGRWYRHVGQICR